VLRAGEDERNDLARPMLSAPQERSQEEKIIRETFGEVGSEARRRGKLSLGEACLEKGLVPIIVRCAWRGGPEESGRGAR